MSRAARAASIPVTFDIFVSVSLRSAAVVAVVAVVVVVVIVVVLVVVVNAVVVVVVANARVAVVVVVAVSHPLLSTETIGHKITSAVLDRRCYEQLLLTKQARNCRTVIPHYRQFG